jgi:hypothetical protein
MLFQQFPNTQSIRRVAKTIAEHHHSTESGALRVGVHFVELELEPLALTAPEWFTFTRMAVAVEADGRVRGTPDETSLIEVATDLDPEGAHTAFLRTLGCPPPSAPKDM